MRQNAERAGKAPWIAEIPVVDSDVKTSRKQVRCCASGSAAPAAAAAANARPGEEITRESLRRWERFVTEKKWELSLRTMIIIKGIFVYVHPSIFSTASRLLLSHTALPMRYNFDR